MTNKEFEELKNPDKKKEPYSYHKWKDYNLLKATTTERILMLKLADIQSTNAWLFRKEKWDWDKDDMRKFVEDVSKEIDFVWKAKLKVVKKRIGEIPVQYSESVHVLTKVMEILKEVFE